MNKLILFKLLTIIFIFNGCAPYRLPLRYLSYARDDQPITFTDELGDVIDKAEAERYSLFTKIGNFKEAKFYPIDSGGFEIEITMGSGVIKVANMDPYAQKIMRSYFKNFDTVRNDSLPFKIKWQILDYDDYGIPITRHETRRLERNMNKRIMGASLGFAVFNLLGLGIGGLVNLLDAEQPRMQTDWIFPDITTGDCLMYASCIFSPFIGAPIGYKIAEKLEERHKVNLIKKSRSHKLKQVDRGGN